MKKTGILLLALILILGCTLAFTSCEWFNKPQNNADAVKIIENGVTEYMVVYPENRSDALYNAASELVTAIERVTGTRIQMIKASSELEEIDGKYILVGATSFEEYHKAVEPLASTSDAYTITQSGKHIVFGGRLDDGIVASVKHFTENLLAKNYNADTQTLALEECKSDGTKALATIFDTTEIEKYTIVYSTKMEGYREAAEAMKTLITATTGHSLKVGADTSTPPSEFEILIGNTDRPLSYKCYKNGMRLMEYSAVVENGQMQVVCGGPYSARIGSSNIVTKSFSNGTAKFENGTHCVTNLAPETVARKEGTDIRIMTANVLTYDNSAKNKGFNPSYERVEILAKVLVDYAPDIIGIQEMDKTYHSLIPYYLNLIKETYGIEYSTTTRKVDRSYLANFIIYRSDKYVLDYDYSEFAYYDYWGSSLQQSVLSSAKFTSITDPSVEVAMITAHWYWDAENIASDPPQQLWDQIQMSNEFYNIKSMYPNARIFCTGDFNSHRFDGEYLNRLLFDINGEVASSVAERNNVLVPSFKHQDVYIDHIIGEYGKFDVLYHAGTNNQSKDLTDHQPVYADIKFK